MVRGNLLLEKAVSGLDKTLAVNFSQIALLKIIPYIQTVSKVFRFSLV